MTDRNFNARVTSDIQHAEKQKTIGECDLVLQILKENYPNAGTFELFEMKHRVYRLTSHGLAKLDAAKKTSWEDVNAQLSEASIDVRRAAFKNSYYNVQEHEKRHPGRIVLSPECQQAYWNVDSLSEEELARYFKQTVEANAICMQADYIQTVSSPVEYTEMNMDHFEFCACAVASALKRRKEAKAPQMLENVTNEQLADLVVASCESGDITHRVSHRVTLKEIAPALGTLFISAAFFAVRFRGKTVLPGRVGKVVEDMFDQSAWRKLFVGFGSLSGVVGIKQLLDTIFPEGLFNTEFGRAVKSGLQKAVEWVYDIVEDVRQKLSAAVGTVRQKLSAAVDTARNFCTRTDRSVRKADFDETYFDEDYDEEDFIEEQRLFI